VSISTPRKCCRKPGARLAGARVPSRTSCYDHGTFDRDWTDTLIANALPAEASFGGSSTCFGLSHGRVAMTRALNIMNSSRYRRSLGFLRCCHPSDLPSPSPCTTVTAHVLSVVVLFSYRGMFTRRFARCSKHSRLSPSSSSLKSSAAE
jgi:hypothetical protein